MKTLPITLALLAAAGLITSGCSTAPNSADSSSAAHSSSDEARAPRLSSDLRAEVFTDVTRAVLATDPAHLAPAARFAVAEGLPLYENATDVPASLKELVTFGPTPAVGLPEGLKVTAGASSAESADAPSLQHTDITSWQPGGDNSALAGFTVLVAPDTPVGQVAAAQAAGARVLALPVADPRATSESMAAVEAGNVIAVGPGFGSEADFAARVEMVAAGELPGGGGLVFPGRRMVALYGHPSGPALGVMGEQDPQAAVERVRALVEQYQPYSEEPVIPAFEVIATVASASPGPDGDYSNEADPAELQPYVDAIVNAGGYAVLDLQPGRASLLEQAKLYEDLLSHPNVGLALDPEWKIGPDELPMERIGHVEAAEVNEVAQWLAALVREKGLPQKALVLHQFQLQMLRDRSQIDTSAPELAFVLHADGHGPTGVKMETWNVLREGLHPDFFMAWKNFIDEDEPMLDPAATYAVEPRPWFVSYQ
ncbi:cell wall-binding repeat-containing protein [Corynebacterium lizhenjunii]|uniref:cell wall-binding repeat-containing protein n=1 Tax=Corynebacterium lizhenjunii TaxID=2709394 RepID=UPI0013EB4547|nr:cell wall-binding repeat-containing protein [Corynebacterium lizhenjunii]